MQINTKLSQSPRAIYIVNSPSGCLDTRQKPHNGHRIDIDLLPDDIFEADILVYQNGQLLVNGAGGDVWRMLGSPYMLEFGRRLHSGDIVQIIYL